MDEGYRKGYIDGFADGKAIGIKKGNDYMKGHLLTSAILIIGAVVAYFILVL